MGLGEGGADQVESAHLAQDRRVGLLMEEGLQPARRKSVLAAGAGACVHHSFIDSELRVELQRIDPVEQGFCRLNRGSFGEVESKSRPRTRGFWGRQTGITAVASISTLAWPSISAVTWTAVIAALNLPISSRKATPISG